MNWSPHGNPVVTDSKGPDVVVRAFFVVGFDLRQIFED